MTAWKIASIDGKDPLPLLTLTLAVDSNDPAVLDVIELTARTHRIGLQRMDTTPGFLTKDTR